MIYWLHVDGKYIKTSPSANPPNQIFVAAGVAIDQESGATSRSAETPMRPVFKGQGVNIVRFSINTSPAAGCNTQYYAPGEKGLTSLSIRCTVVQKANQLYVFFDQHEYFHQLLIPAIVGSQRRGVESTQIQAWIKNDWVTLATKYKDEPWVAGKNYA